MVREGRRAPSRCEQPATDEAAPHLTRVAAEQKGLGAWLAQLQCWRWVLAEEQARASTLRAQQAARHCPARQQRQRGPRLHERLAWAAGRQQSERVSVCCGPGLFLLQWQQVQRAAGCGGGHAEARGVCRGTHDRGGAAQWRRRRRQQQLRLHAAARRYSANVPVHNATDIAWLREREPSQSTCR